MTGCGEPVAESTIRWQIDRNGVDIGVAGTTERRD
jgi:hypothetical protein